MVVVEENESPFPKTGAANFSNLLPRLVPLYYVKPLTTFLRLSVSTSPSIRTHHLVMNVLNVDV